MRNLDFVLSSFMALAGLTVSLATQAAEASCSVALPPTPSGGCTLVLTTATNCETLDARTTGYYEFAWSTLGTFCESPMKILIAGSPDSSWLYGDNYLLYTISAGTTTGAYVSRTSGGYIHLAASELARLSTDNGQYSWGVQSFHGSGSGTGVFKVASATSTAAPAISDSDRIFNWAETHYAQYLKPAGAKSQTVSGYYVRYYALTNVYVGTANGNVYVYGPQFFGPAIVNLGAVASWLSQAKAGGY